MVTETPKITILLVDDSALWRAKTRGILTRQPGYEIIAEACDGEEAVMMATNLQPHIVILDIGLPGINGIEAAKLIREKSPKSAIIFF